MTESNDRDPIGTVADEARKLFESIQGRATRQVGKTMFNSFTGGGRRERDVWEEAVSEPHDEYICRACPVCRAIAAQRESGGGDVTGHLMAAGGELFAAFKGALDALGKPAPRTSGPRDDRPDDRPDDDPRDDVERIDLN
jgi:phage-related minor tail protein